MGRANVVSDLVSDIFRELDFRQAGLNRLDGFSSIYPQGEDHLCRLGRNARRPLGYVDLETLVG